MLLITFTHFCSCTLFRARSTWFGDWCTWSASMYYMTSITSTAQWST